MAADRSPFPLAHRLALGFFCAPAAAGFFYTLPFFHTWDPGIALIGAIAAIPIGLIFGVPAFLLAWRFGVRPSLLNCVMAGGLVAATPGIVVTFPEIVRLPTGIISQAMVLSAGQFLVSGCVAGFVFWLCVVFRDPRYTQAPAAS